MIDRLARLFGSPGTVVCVTGAEDHRILDINEGFERILGVSRDEAIGRTTIDLGLWRDERVRRTILTQLAQNGVLVHEPVVIRAKDGGYSDGLLSAEILVHEGKRYVFAMIQDVRHYDDQRQAHARELESFRSLFTAADIGVYRRWPGGRGYVDVNPAMAAMLGYDSPADLLKEPCETAHTFYVDPAHAARVHETLKRDGRISREHSQLRRRDGTTIWVSESARAVTGTSGDLLFYEGTLADISREVAAQEALELSERLHRTLIENCRDGVFLMQHGVIVFCNEALAAPLGYTAGDLTGAQYASFIAPVDMPAQQVRRDSREGGSMDVQSFRVNLLHRDGSIRLFEVSAGAVVYGGEPASIGTMRDITDEDAAQQRVAAAEERYRLAVWGSGDELFDWDLVAGTLIPATAELRGAVGAAFSMPTVDHLKDYIHPDDLDAYKQSIVDHLEGRTPHFEGSYRLRSRNGNWRWKLARGMIVARDADGKPTRLIGTQKDISKLKATEAELLELTHQLDARVQRRTRELEEEGIILKATNIQLTNAIDELRKMQSELIEAEKMASLGRLVAGVAHEVNTPLGVGMTAISFLRSQLNSAKSALVKVLPPERVQQLLEPLDSAASMAESNMHRAANLIKSFKQVAVDQSTSTIRTIAVREYLEGILQSLHPALKKARHHVIVECDPLVAVKTRPDALYQVISNLVMNSIIHGFPDGRAGEIRIGATLHEKHLELVYIDDGVGMDDAIVGRVFEPFFTTRRDHGGTGLGMHIAFNLVTQALAGRISCSSVPGHGVRFDIAFPRVHPSAEQPVAATA